MRKKIEWNGFLKHAMDECPNEVCGFLYSDKPLEEDGQWFVFPVENIAKDKRHSWIPDKKELKEIKEKAREMKLIKIGNVHTHPIPSVREGATLELMDEAIKPSDIDLKFAKRFNDIIRGIMLVSKIAIYGIEFHDMFGRKIEVYLDEQIQSP